MMKHILEMLFATSKHSLREMVDEITEQIQERTEEITKRNIFMMKETIPPIIYSTVFLAVGMIILVWGGAAIVDKLIGIQGSGMVIGGFLLVLLGIYYSNRTKNSLERMEMLYK